MIRIIDILGINDNNKIIVEHNKGSLQQSQFKIEGNGIFLKELKEKEIVVSQLFLGGRRCDVNLNLSKNVLLHNSIGIAENHEKSLSQLIEILSKVKNPVINHPKSVLLTSRDKLTKILSGIEGVVLPKCIKVIPKTTKDVLESIRENRLTFPLLVRPINMHGSETLFRLNSTADIETLQRFAFDGINAFYLTQFIDYKSEDGFYRKVRFLLVGNEVIPRHLILSPSWQIHTENKDSESKIRQKQKEEEIKFLSSVTLETGKKLLMVKKAIGLDYLGIDCSIDSKGNIVIFEANPYSMVGIGKDEGYHQNIIEEAHNALRRLIGSKAIS